MPSEEIPPRDIPADIAFDSIDSSEKPKTFEGPFGPNPETVAGKVKKRSDNNLPVCIIGAGPAGLYTAMIFESLGIKYQIVEANKEERIGGRLYTYRFPGGGPYDYFDVGAMRFRDTAFMKRTFNLFRMEKLKLKLIPYIREMVDHPHTFLYFNNNRSYNWASPDADEQDPFKVNSPKFLGNDKLATHRAVRTKVAEVIKPFRDIFRPRSDGTLPKVGEPLELFLRATDRWSMRTYMLTESKMDANDVSWCEALDSATGTYDLSLSQYVMSSLAVNLPTKPVSSPEEPEDENEGWYCLDGGSGKLPQAMFKSLSQDAQKEALFESPVIAISCKQQKDKDVEVMEVSIRGEETPRQYSAVISTVPLPCLTVMDLSESGIHKSYARWNAIRSLNYGTALKIGMRFTEAWWEELPKPIHGGQSYTDTVLGTVVYPSYPEKATKETRSKVLIVAYVRLQDAERLTSLLNSDGSAKPGLVDLILRDLARVHDLKVDYIKERYQDIKENFFAWDWMQDPFATGYPFFAPGAYGNNQTYAALIRPAALGKLFIAGEAASTAHEWVVGALYSSWRAVYQYLYTHDPAKLGKLYELWGENEYWIDKERRDGGENFSDRYRQLMNKNIVIALQEDGLEFPPESEAPLKSPDPTA